MKTEQIRDIEKRIEENKDKPALEILLNELKYHYEQLLVQKLEEQKQVIQDAIIREIADATTKGEPTSRLTRLSNLIG